jgi:hypothetical protein
MEAAPGQDAADQAKWLVLLGFLCELSKQHNPERVHCAVMPQEELEVTAQLRRVHPVEQVRVHLPGTLPYLDLGVRN